MSVPVMTAIAAGVLVLGSPVLLASNAAAAGATAASAADSASLAIADSVLGFLASGTEMEPCALAADLVRRHGATLAGCEVDTVSGEARVTANARIGLFSVTRSARAGPPDEAPTARL